jgi:hypothetical protein
MLVVFVAGTHTAHSFLDRRDPGPLPSLLGSGSKCVTTRVWSGMKRAKCGYGMCGRRPGELATIGVGMAAFAGKTTLQDQVILRRYGLPASASRGQDPSCPHTSAGHRSCQVECGNLDVCGRECRRRPQVGASGGMAQVPRASAGVHDDPADRGSPQLGDEPPRGLDDL